MTEYHQPVLSDEVLGLMDPKPGQTIVDCTLGGASHSKAFLERILPGGRLIGIDRDADAIDQARSVLGENAEGVTLVRGDFGDLKEIIEGLRIGLVDGVFFDLGVSSHQLNTPERGFSFTSDAPLDMRMDTSRGETAADLVNRLSERELSQLIFVHSDERWAAKIARAIVERRQVKPITTTSELADIVSKAIPAKFHPPKTHAGTRTFQALRIVVNAELDSLDRGLDGAVDVLSESGKLAVISYHSLEDRKVKQFITAHSGRCQCPPGLPMCVCGAVQTLRPLTRKPVVPTPEEIDKNPRARSAKLRVAEKIGPVGSGS